MADTIKAIETFYGGYRFRSRLEARWAVFFDTLKISYEYEPEGFNLGNGICYLPDFYLPDYNLYIEIKRAKAFIETDDDVYLADEEDNEKIKLFHDHIVEETPQDALIVVSGDPVDFLLADDCHTSAMYAAACCAFAFAVRYNVYEHEEEIKSICPCTIEKCNTCDLMNKFAHYNGYVRMFPSCCIKDENIFPPMRPKTEYTFITGPGDETGFILMNISSLRWIYGDLDLVPPFDAMMKMYNAAKKARQARFEHGETPEVNK